MLDAAHGDTVRASEPPAQRIHAGRMETQKARTGTPDVKSRRRPYVSLVTDVPQVSRRPVAVARSRRKEQSLGGMRRRVRNNDFYCECRCVVLRLFRAVRAAALAGGGPQTSGCRRACPAGCVRNYSQRIFLQNVRPGRLRGSRFQREPAPGARPKTLASALPHQRNSRNVGHACHNCHSERSESTNAASAETACGLCRARRRKTNEVQSNICILTIQILRRSAPQNDKTGRTEIRTTRWDRTIHCSQTPQQTGICNWRQRGKVERKDVRGGRSLQR